MHRLRSFVAVLFGSVCAHAAEPAAHSSSRTSSLSWIRLPGAEPCVSAQDLARDVEQRLGHAVFVSPSRADVSVEGRIEPNVGKPGWRSVVVLRDAKGASLGTRELRRDDASCDPMRAAVALVVAVMIDPDAALAPPPPATPPPPVVIERPVPVIVEVPVAAAPPPPPAPPSWRLDVGSGFIGGAGLLPEPAVGVVGQAILEPRRFIGVEAYGAIWLDRNAPTASQGSATFSLAYVGSGLCPLHLRAARLEAYGCASGQLGYLRSFGPTSTPDQGQVYLAGAFDARVTIHIVGPFIARAGVAFVVPLIRESFFYDLPGGGHGELFRMSPVAGTVDAGLGVALP